MANADRNRQGDQPDGFGSHVREIIQEQIRQREGLPAPSQMEGVGTGAVPWEERDLLRYVRTVAWREISGFTRELAILLRVGTPILQALRSIGQRTTNTRLRETIYQVGVRVENGHAFWEALSEFPHLFNSLYVSSVRTGEASGNLDSVLERLADYADQRSNLRRRMWGIVAYPALVIILAIVVCGVLSSFVLPVFMDMFETFGADLPVLSNVIFNAVAWLSLNWYWIIAGLAGLFILYKITRLIFPVRLLTDRLKLYLPIAGTISAKITVARFARSFAMLYQSGVPIVEALSISRGSVDNEVVALHIDHIREMVENGHSLEQGLREGRVFPGMFADMLGVGEQAGNLGEVLEKAAEVYENEANITMTGLGTLVEPLLILLIGALVLVVFAGFFLPYIELLRTASETF